MVTREKNDYSRKVQEKAVIEKVIPFPKPNHLPRWTIVLAMEAASKLFEYILENIISCVWLNLPSMLSSVTIKSWEDAVSSSKTEISANVGCVVLQRQMAIERCTGAAAAAPAEPEPPTSTHVLTLEHGEHNDSTLYR